MKKQLRVLLAMVFFASAQLVSAQCDIDVTVSSSGWGDVTSWELQDGGGTAVLTGGTYGNGYTDNQTTVLNNPPYTLVFTINNSAFCDNDPDYNVLVGGGQDIQGQVNVGCIDDVVSIPLNATTCPTCPSPSNLLSSNVTATSFDLDWTEGDTETLWNIEWGTPGFAPGTTNELGSDNGNTSQTSNITGLTASSQYDVYVQADCGGGNGQSSWVGPLTVTTAQIPVTSFPYLEDFETGATDWSITNAAAVNQWQLGTATNNGGNNSLYVSNDGGTSNAYTINTYSVVHAYRDFSIPANAAAIQLSFDWKANAESGFDYLRVWAVPTSYVPNSGTAFGNMITADAAAIPDGRINLTGNLNLENDWVTFTDLIPNGYAGNDIRIVFEWKNDGSVGTQPPAALDNVSMAIFNCSEPTNLEASNITSTTADLDWILGDSETEWEVEYGLSGFALGSGTNSTVTTNPEENLTGLDVNTTYDVYVRAVCGPGDESSWVGPITFSTACITFTSPYAENFDGTTWVSGTGFANAGDAIDGCWSRNPGNSGDLFWGTRTATTGSGTTGPDTDVSGTGNYVFIEASNGDEGDSAFLTSPFIDLAGLTLPELTFSYHMFGATTGALGVDVSNDNGLTWDNVWQLSGQQQTAGSDPWLTANVILPGFIGDEVQIRFVGVKGAGFTGDLAIDEVAVDEGPSCPGINSITMVNVLPDEATATWNQAYLETQWEIEYDTTGFVLGNGNNAIVADTFNVMTGLTSNTTYDIYLRAVCGSGDESVWLGPISFTTPCDIFPTPYIESFDGSSWISGTGFNNVSSEISDCWTNTPSGSAAGTQPYFWGTRTGTTSNAATGPTAAAGGIGNYVYVESSNGGATDTALFDSPMIDLSMINDPVLTFSYHMYGANADSLSVEISSDGGVTFDSILTIVGAQQFDNADEWIDTSLVLDDYINDTIIVRFLTVKSSFNGDIAIDEFSILSCIPDGGVDNETDVCRLDESLDLNDEITINQGGGKWDFPANQSLITNESIFNVSTLPTGNYSVYYIVPGACEDDTTILSLNIFPPSSAGINGTIQACRNQPINLFDGLNGNVDMGGDWYDPSGSPVNGSQPISSNIPGSFNYDYIVSNGVCPADTQFVEVIVGTCDYLSVGSEEMQEISVFPNPATEMLNILNGSNLEGLKIEMYDATGRLVLTDNKALANAVEASISIAHLETGSYTLRVKNNDGERIFKIIKQ